MGTLVTPTRHASGQPVLRPYRGPQDHPAMSRVANVVRAYNGDPNVGTAADMDTYYAGFDQDRLPRDCAIVELDGLVVAYGRVSWDLLASGGGQAGGILNIDPAYRGRGIEELLLVHAINRAEELATTLAGGQAIDLTVAVTDRDPEQRAVAERLGFQVGRSFAQLIRPTLEDIPDVPLPEGFEVRPIVPDDRAMHRRVYDAGARAFADSWREEAPSEAGFQRFISSPTFNPALWRVAFHGDEIAGQILNFLDEQVDPGGGRIGWTESISVQPEFRRRGLARALLAASLRSVRDAGATRAALGVDLMNPRDARALYESLGFRIVSREHALELGPFPRAVR